MSLDPKADIPAAPTLLTFYSDGTFKNNSQCPFRKIDPSSVGTYELRGIASNNVGELIMSVEDSLINDTFQIELSGRAMVLTEDQKIETVQGTVTAIHQFNKR